ncbi:hypothetical protein [Sinorhizobium meliloti]|uniref:hypothetical protein n=1 Tax=Rhizobium meliloti TaxID=382 RepID=UPI0011C3D104|nr:hypothetical protein [Sinorhizobium meliloti]
MAAYQKHQKSATSPTISRSFQYFKTDGNPLIEAVERFFSADYFSFLISGCASENCNAFIGFRSFPSQKRPPENSNHRSNLKVSAMGRSGDLADTALYETPAQQNTRFARCPTRVSTAVSQPNS